MTDPIGWTYAALDRIAELEPELMREFGMRPIVVDRGGPNRSRGSTYPEDIEAWFLERGVNCRIRLEGGGRIGFDAARLVER